MSVLPLFSTAREYTGTLLIKALDHGAREIGDHAVAEQQWDGHHQAQYRRDQRLGNASRHQLGITGAKQTDRLKRDNHTRHRPQQAQ